MSKITTSRITEVFKLLGQSKTNNVPVSSGPKSDAKKLSTSHLSRKHDPELLKVKLISRLTKLTSNTETFEYDATQVMIEEILVWEFGDKILAVSEYKLVKDSLVGTLLNTPILHNNLQATFKNLLK